MSRIQSNLIRWWKRINLAIEIGHLITIISSWLATSKLLQHDLCVYCSWLCDLVFVLWWDRVPNGTQFRLSRINFHKDNIVLKLQLLLSFSWVLLMMLGCIDQNFCSVACSVVASHIAVFIISFVFPEDIICVMHQFPWPSLLRIFLFLPLFLIECLLSLMSFQMTKTKVFD